MGRCTSKASGDKGTPLACVLNNWRGLVGKRSGLKKRCIIKLCTEVWPSALPVNPPWPETGSFSPDALKALARWAEEELKKGEQDNVRYASCFLTIAKDPSLYDGAITLQPLRCHHESDNYIAPPPSPEPPLPPPPPPVEEFAPEKEEYYKTLLAAIQDLKEGQEAVIKKVQTKRLLEDASGEYTPPPVYPTAPPVLPENPLPGNQEEREELQEQPQAQAAVASPPAPAVVFQYPQPQFVVPQFPLGTPQPHLQVIVQQPQASPRKDPERVSPDSSDVEGDGASGSRPDARQTSRHTEPTRSPVITRARAGQVDSSTQKADGIFPLREQIVVQPDGGIRRACVYVPFSTADLFNWKSNYPKYSEDPEKLAELIRGIVLSHNPTWGDMMHLLNVLLTEAERKLVWESARKYATEKWRDNTNQTYLSPTDVVPEARPAWDQGQTDEHMTSLERFRESIVAGLMKGFPKQIASHKVHEVFQKKEENPAEYLERLVRAFRQYTELDPEAESARTFLNSVYINNAYEDIKRKLNKVDGHLSVPVQQLVEIAFKVFNNRAAEEAKEAQKEAQKILLASAQGTGFPRRGQHGHRPTRRGIPGRGRGARGGWTGSQPQFPTVGPQPPHAGPYPGGEGCRICGDHTHWARSCPQNPNRSTCHVCGDPNHWADACPYRSSQQGQGQFPHPPPQGTAYALETGAGQQ